MLPLKAYVFGLLNIVRLLSVVFLCLAFAAIVVLNKDDMKALRESKQADAEDLEDCAYIADSDIPLSTWGIFWLFLDRTFLMIACLLGLLSETTLGQWHMRALSSYLPILGPSHSTAFLGFMQSFISTSLLAHYQEGFPLVAFWLLFWIGIVNMVLGLTFGPRGKRMRSLIRGRRDVADKARGSRVKLVAALVTKRGAKKNSGGGTGDDALEKGLLRRNTTKEGKRTASIKRRSPGQDLTNRLADAQLYDVPFSPEAAGREPKRSESMSSSIAFNRSRANVNVITSNRAYGAITEDKSSFLMSRSASASYGREFGTAKGVSATQPISSVLQAFPSSVTDDATRNELLRRRAREENERIEREMEAKEKEKQRKIRELHRQIGLSQASSYSKSSGGGSSISGGGAGIKNDFEWDTRNSMPLERGASVRNEIPSANAVQLLVERGQRGAANDLSAPSTPTRRSKNGEEKKERQRKPRKSLVLAKKSFAELKRRRGSKPLPSSQLQDTRGARYSKLLRERVRRYSKPMMTAMPGHSESRWQVIDKKGEEQEEVMLPRKPDMTHPRPAWQQDDDHEMPHLPVADRFAYNPWRGVGH